MADGSKAGMVMTTLGGSILATVVACLAQTGQPSTGTLPGMSGPAGISAKAPATAAGRSGASEAPFFVAAGIVAMAALVAAMLQRRIAGPAGLAPPSQTTATQEQARLPRAQA